MLTIPAVMRDQPAFLDNDLPFDNYKLLIPLFARKSNIPPIFRATQKGTKPPSHFTRPLT